MFMLSKGRSSILCRKTAHVSRLYIFTFQILTKETLSEYGFDPQHAPYYVVLHFDNNPVNFKKQPNLKECLNTYRAKIRPLSDFVGIK